MKITKAMRARIREIVGESNRYDEDTVIIRREGYVEAKLCADKMMRAVDDRLYLVGHVDTLILRGSV